MRIASRVGGALAMASIASMAPSTPTRTVHEAQARRDRRNEHRQARLLFVDKAYRLKVAAGPKGADKPLEEYLSIAEQAALNFTRQGRPAQRSEEIERRKDEASRRRAWRQTRNIARAHGRSMDHPLHTTRWVGSAP